MPFSGGTFEGRGDNDWFRVHLVAGKTYRLTSQSGQFGTASLGLILPNGESFAPPVAFSNLINFVAPVTGDYFVSVQDFGTEGFYQVDLTELNDPLPGAISTTATLAVGETRHYANAVADDWYAIDLVAGKSYFLATDSPGEHTYIADASGEVVAIEDYGPVHFTPTESGRYYAGVSAFSSYSSSITLSEVADDRGDNPGQAGGLPVGSPRTGRWETSGDHDWYAINLQAGKSYSITALAQQSYNSDGLITVYDASGTKVSDQFYYGMIFSPQTSGIYYIDAADSGRSPDYYIENQSFTLTANLLASDLTDNILTSGVLTIGGQMTGQWQGALDRDWVKVTLVAGQTYDFTLTRPADLYNSTLALYDSSGRAVNPGRFGTGAQILHQTIETSGTYFVAVINSNQGIGGYTLSATTVADGLANNATTTGRIEVNEIATATFQSAHDVDWFAVDLVAGKTYQIGGEAYLIRDALGNILTNSSAQTFSPTTTGTYYVEAAGSQGAYDVSITEIYDDYRSDDQTIGALRDLVNGTNASDQLSGSDFHDFLNGNGGDDLLIAGKGFDLYFGGAGSDTLSFDKYAVGADVDLGRGRTFASGMHQHVIASVENVIGSRFNDNIVGSSAVNRLTGGNGDDVLAGGGGGDMLIGGAGSDFASYEGSAGGVIVNLGTGALSGFDADGDVLNEIENLRGSAFADVLTGNGAANIIAGGDGDDLIDGGAGVAADKLDGGNGIDTISYAGATARINLNLGVTAQQNTMGAGFDRLSGFENIIGSAFNDSLAGTAADNLIEGGAGLDMLTGLAGNDTLKGGVGNDILVGGDGDDTLEGGTGSDMASYAGATAAVTVSLLVAGPQATGGGNDTLAGIEGLTGTSLNDTLTGDANNNTLRGGLGNDTLSGDLGNDLIDGGSGTDTLDYSGVGAGIRVALDFATAQNTVGAGTDTIRGIENVIGTAFNDFLTGNAFGNVLTGGAGNDTLVGLVGNDVLNGGDGIDMVDYATATSAVTMKLNVTIAQSTGGAGSDQLLGIESLNGTGFNDVLTGNASDNVLIGNAGDDTLNGLLGNDTLNGGAGVDTVSYFGVATGVTVTLALATAQNTIGAGTDTLLSIENLIGSAADDTLTGSTANNIITGGLGNDVLDGGTAGNDTLDGRGGNDTLRGGTSNDILTGGSGNDLIDGGTGTDTVLYTVTSAAVTVNLGLTTAQAVGGGQGIDTLASVENIVGSAFGDTLIGSAVANSFTGGAGKDTITGGAGNDRFIYTATADSTVGANTDRITDLMLGDILDLSAIDANANTVGVDDAFRKVAAFTGVAGQFTLVFDASSNTTMLRADNTGDGVTDFSILFTGDVAATTVNWVL